MKASGRKMKEKMFLASIVIISKCRECCHAIAKMDIRVQFPLGIVCINFVFYVCENSIQHLQTKISHQSFVTIFMRCHSTLSTLFRFTI